MRSLLICTHHHLWAVQGGIPFALLPLILPGQEPNISFGNYVPSPADLPHLGGCQPRKAMKCARLPRVSRVSITAAGNITRVERARETKTNPTSL